MRDGGSLSSAKGSCPKALLRSCHVNGKYSGMHLRGTRAAVLVPGCSSCSSSGVDSWPLLQLALRFQEQPCLSRCYHCFCTLCHVCTRGAETCTQLSIDTIPWFSSAGKPHCSFPCHLSAQHLRLQHGLDRMAKASADLYLALSPRRGTCPQTLVEWMKRGLCQQ